jgi:hypothetical protein
MSIARDLRCLRVLFAFPEAVELSVLIGVGGWGWYSILAVNEETSDFGVGGRCHAVAELVANGMDGAVGGWICGRHLCRVTGVRAETVTDADATASCGHRQIGSVAIDVEDHATSVVAKCGIRMGVRKSLSS